MVLQGGYARILSNKTLLSQNNLFFKVFEFGMKIDVIPA